MAVRRRTSIASLQMLLLLSLLSILPSLAQARSPRPGAAAHQPVPASTVTPEPIDCNSPLPGKRVTLATDLEILAAVSNGQMVNVDRLDNKSNTDPHLVYDWTWNPDDYAFYFPFEQALAAGDVDGDGKAEAIGALFNQNEYQLEAYVIQNPEASGNDLVYHLWQGTSAGQQGDNINWVDATVGNLFGAAGDAADQAVIAFQDESNNLQVVVLDGGAAGGLHQSFTWTSNTHHRYQPSWTAVTLGDLDGDGYDNEMVLAFADGWGDLQVVVLQYTSKGQFVELAWDYWSGNARSGIQNIDVATGDFQGDPRDDIAVGFRDGNGWLQVMALEYDSAGTTEQARLNSTGYWQNDGNYRDDIQALSLAGGDINGDGWDEIVVAFVNRMTRMQIITFNAQSGTPTPRGYYWNDGGDRETVKDIATAVGDLDGDGKAEVTVALIDLDDDMEVLSLEDNPQCPCTEDKENGLTWRDGWTDVSGDGQLPAIALGDIDGTNLYADYTGQCGELTEASLVAMVGRPPYWESLNPETDVGYGTSIKGGNDEEDHITNSYGGSATFDASFDFAGFRIGPSFTKEWDHSVTQSWAKGSSQETKDGWTSPDGLVTLNDITYYGYQYQRRDGNGLIRVSIPVDTKSDSKVMSFWNQPDGAKTLFPASWVPAAHDAWQDPQPIFNFAPDFPDVDLYWGLGTDFYDFNGNGVPDYLVAAIIGQHNSGHNVFYKIGFDVQPNGVPRSYSAWIPIWDSIGNISAGLGAAITELNGNDTPELVLAWIDAPPGEHFAYYRVVWDLAASGAYQHWDPKQPIPGWVGANTQGSDLEVTDLNGDGLPEIILGWIDSPSGDGKGYYRVGWGLDSQGNVANWWADPQPIPGNFGAQDAGLGLKIADANGNGEPEMIAAWVSETDNGNLWGLLSGEPISTDGSIDYWSPLQTISGTAGIATAAVSLAATRFVTDDVAADLVLGWIDGGTGAQQASVRIGKILSLAGEVDQRPTAVDDADPDDGFFYINFRDLWWSVTGKLLWQWDATQGNQPIYVSVGGGAPYWEVTDDQFSEQTVDTSESYNYTVGGEAEYLGVGYEGSSTEGFEEGTSYTVSWETGFFMDGQSSGLPYTATQNMEYTYTPYTYMDSSVSITGVVQSYMVLDYFVPWRGGSASSTAVREAAAPLRPLLQPGVPVIASSSHPDPNIWYSDSTAVFTWAQPAGDPATVDGYRWYLDHSADTVPSAVSQGPAQSATYDGLSDGIWFLHVRARDASGTWSDAGRREVRVDTHPPAVEIALAPSYPLNADGWYNTPVTVTVTAADPSTGPGQTGSGVQSVEYSTDGSNWQPYAAPLVFAAETPPVTLYARATDHAGHVSTPTSATFALDMTAPHTMPPSPCWLPGGICAAEVITDSMGNQQLHLAGTLDASLSGQRGVNIQFATQAWAAAESVQSDRWRFASRGEVGAGCYGVAIQAADRAGNLEQIHPFGATIVWQPQAQPDLSGSRLAITPDHARPGDVVTVTLTVPNIGWQESWTAVSVTVPATLHPLVDSISAGGIYAPAEGLITWPAAYLWPGQERSFSFSAQVDAAAPADDVVVALSATGSWPIAANCPPAAVPSFRNLETVVATAAALIVDPAPPDNDVTAPAPPLLRIDAGQVAYSPQTTLRIQAQDGSDARWMALREWVWSSTDDGWIVRQESGWVPYSATYSWQLSAGDGVKYMGVWLADAAWNISTLDRRSLAYTNLLQGNQFLADGDRVQYRFLLAQDDTAVFAAASLQGEPGLYVWRPRSGFHPEYVATDAGVVNAVRLTADRHGLYLVEVKALGDSRYQLLLGGDVDRQANAAVALAASAPEHPLTVSDPLNAGAGSAPLPPTFQRFYLPVITHN